MIVAATGHRPEKLADRAICYEPIVLERLTHLAIAAFQKMQPAQVISGMALGWDSGVALAAIALNIPLVAAVPFKGQESAWRQGDRDRYFEILDNAIEVVYVCDPGYAAWKMQKRNELMCDRSDVVLALWDGGEKGGTKNCVDYARSKNKRVINVWNSWDRFSGIF